MGAPVAGLILLLLAFVFGMRAKSPVVLRAVRRFNRRFMNPRQMKTAGTPGAYAGVIRHRGRRSGRVYETPVGRFATDDGFVCGFDAETDAGVIEDAARGLGSLFVAGDRYLVQVPDAAAEQAVRGALAG